MGGEKKDRRLTVSQIFVAGGISGVASRTITSPLDVIKILFQVGTNNTKNGFLNSFKILYKNEGIAAFWKGNGIACVRLFPYSAIQFSAFNQLKLVLGDDKKNAFIAGSTAGTIATVVTYPTDFVKTRLTIDHADKTTGNAKYRGMIDCFRVVLKEEGALAFYKGMSTSIIGVIPFSGFTFLSYEFLDRAWGKPKDQITPLQNFINGCLAASFAQTFSFPFDTIRKKLQAQNNKAGSPKYNGMIDCFVKTVKSDGILGLWRGTIANLAKVAPYAGIMFASYEACKRVYLYQNGYTVSPFKDEAKPGVDQSLKPNELKNLLKENKS